MTAATALLDAGGEEAVTLRAVAQASGVSHNAPYKHFESRDALLAAVAMNDFALLTTAFQKAKASKKAPIDKLMSGLRTMLSFSYEHQGRYQLLFNNPKVARGTGELQQVARGAFVEFVALVKECQTAGSLPQVAETTIASLLFATMQGLIAIEANGGMHSDKGLHGVEDSLKVLIGLIAPKRSDMRSKNND